MSKMDKLSIEERAQAEYKRLMELLNDAGISNNKERLLEPIVVNAAWMKAKLDDSRDTIRNGQIVISYNNGGGQKGIRENPLFKGYESLWKSYMQGMNRIIDALPEDDAQAEFENATKPRTVLELVRDKHKKGA